VATGQIAQASADELLAENRRTPITELESWIGRSRHCDAPSRCSSDLGKRFKEAVTKGDHVKPLTHWSSEMQKWHLFEEHDGEVLRRLHQEIHDRRSGVRPGQTRLMPFAAPR
jgi:hypothetical protein